MTSTAVFVPSMALHHATRQAVTALAAHWPKLLQMSLDHSASGQQFLDDYAFALRDVDVRAIPLAVRTWIADEQYAPKPAELARVARDISQRQFPRSSIPIAPPPLDQVKADARVHALGRRAYRVLGSWTAVEDVWAWLYQTATDTADLQRLRFGDVVTDRFDDAIRHVRAKRAVTPPIQEIVPS